jgi:hypothetical protein
MIKNCSFNCPYRGTNCKYCNTNIIYENIYNEKFEDYSFLKEGVGKIALLTLISCIAVAALILKLINLTC